MRLLAFIGFVLLGTAAAQAASFDCDRARTAFENAICDFPSLSRQDEVLAKAYATALGGLSKAAADEMKRGQRDWLSFAERACTDNARPLRGDYDDDDLPCLEGLFTARIRDLEESRMRSGRRFYPVEGFLVIPDPDATADSWNKVATKQFSSPRIDGTDAEARGFNRLMSERGNTIDELIGTMEGTGDASDDGSTDNHLAILVDSITGRRITVVINDWWYGHGAAHGNYAITYQHYLLAERRALQAEDIFVGTRWQRNLAALAFDALEDLFSDEGALFISGPGEIADAVADPARWNFSDAGLILQFQPYEVTAYAAGAPTVTIPWGRLSGFLTDDAEAIAYY